MCLPRFSRGCAGVLLAVLAGGHATALRSERLDLLPSVLGVTELYAADQRSGLALAGLDPVTYLLDAQPLAGVPGNELIHDGVVWRFVSHANRAVFTTRPDAFLPRFGGYDPLGVTGNVLVVGDPRIFAVRSGRLYLFHTSANRERFLEDETLAEQAEARWPILRARLVKG